MPGGVLVEVERVNAEVPDAPLMDEGLKLALAPDGRPEALRLTVPVKAPMEATATE